MNSDTSTGFISNCINTTKKTFLLLLESFKTIAAAPLQWKWFHWLTLAVFLTATVLAYIWKSPIHEFFRGSGVGLPETIADVGKNFGDFEVPVILSLLLILCGCLKGWRKWMDAGTALLAAGGIAGLVTLSGQFILAEQRPIEGGLMAFFALGGHGVSGHVTSSALFLWPLANILFKDAKKLLRSVVFVLLIGWPLFVAWSRMYDDKHFLWNVLLGLATGFTCGYITVKAYEMHEQT